LLYQDITLDVSIETIAGSRQLNDKGIDAHGLKIQGRGYLMFFAKIPGGVEAFRKNCLGGPLI
jgi:hypothetical protein